MICKNSFYKSVYETIRHHLAAIFATCLVFFIQVVVFFLNLQNYASASYKDYRYECLMNLTLPNTAYVVPIVFIGFLLAFDFFKYLHIKNQVDFYDSLPVCRRDWFLLRSSSAVLIFLIPYSICTLLEMILLAVTGFGTKVFLINLCWVFISMTCIYLSTFLAGTVVMIVTGNPVIGCFGFSFISIYAPYILRYIYPNYASQYFKTYVSDDTKLDFLEYLSPIGQSVKLLSSDYLEWNVKDHVIDFLMILIVIALTGLLAYFLYLHRPSEAAANAIAFKKAASPIRISIVIPFALYIGLYLMQIAEVASKSWIIFGFFISCVLLHGIIESIFQFDIKALWKHKKQMAFSFLTCIGIASLFWIDAFGFNKYLPESDEVESVIVQNYDCYESIENSDGINGECIEDALALARILIKQDLDNHDTQDGLTFTYRLKNGSVKTRFYYIDYDLNSDMFDKIYASREYKDDICELYRKDWENLSYIKWSDSINEVTLYMSQEEMEHLFEIYLQEYTPLTYSQVRSTAAIGQFNVYYFKDSDEYSFGCYVYPDFHQTIRILEDYIENNEATKDYGSLTESPFSKYEISSIEIYDEDETTTLITDSNEIEVLRENIVLTAYYYDITTAGFDYDKYYDGSVTLTTNSGLRNTWVIIPKNVVDSIK